LTFLLDTNTCIRYLIGRSTQVKGRLQSLRPEDIVLCSVVKGELNYGAARSRDPERTMAHLAEFEAAFTSLPFDDSCVNAYGQIRSELEKAGTPIGPNDLMIAAIALTHGLTLVTHNTREFKRVSRLSWADWEV
jgi:tRNA(fMet)-specific endonuclease VapC